MSPFRQIVRVDRPPVYKRCVQKFGRELVDRPGVIFSWGDWIFNPYNVPISRELRVHEAVHGMRQMSYVPPGWVPSEGDVVNDDRISAWWDRYLDEPLFRLDEELHAHAAEYRAGVKRHGHSPRLFNSIAERLASPLYGNLLSIAQAKHAILTGVVSLDPMKEEPRRRSAA